MSCEIYSEYCQITNKCDSITEGYIQTFFRKVYDSADQQQSKKNGELFKKRNYGMYDALDDFRIR